jgi:orotate phosphoribosyltransferase
MIFEQERYDYLYNWCKSFIDENCIVRNKKMPGKIPGTTYTWMFYLRNGLFQHQFLSAISQLFLYKVQKEIGHFDFQIAGLETASTPMLAGIPLTATAFDISINAFSVRKEKKEYGLKNWIEGLPNDKPVMMIDDLCNSAVSMKKCYDVLSNTKVNQKNIEVMNYAFTIVNKVNKKVHKESRQKTDMYLPEKIKMLYLYDLDDFNLTGPSH